MTITNSNLIAIESRLASNRKIDKRIDRFIATTDREGKLHDQILEECKRRGWLAFHDRMDRPTTGTLGRPDFIILADNGRVIMVECKRGIQKPSTAQRDVIAWAAKLGHTVHVVRSLDDFLSIIRDSK